MAIFLSERKRLNSQDRGTKRSAGLRPRMTCSHAADSCCAQSIYQVLIPGTWHVFVCVHVYVASSKTSDGFGYSALPVVVSRHSLSSYHNLVEPVVFLPVRSYGDIWSRTETTMSSTTKSWGSSQSSLPGSRYIRACCQVAPRLF